MKKKLTKESIDELAKEMPTLTYAEQQDVVGGDDKSDCLFQSIAYMSQQYGCGKTSQQVADEYSKMLQRIYKWTASTADNYIEVMGVNSSHVEALCDKIFSGEVVSGNAYDGMTFSGDVLGITYINSGHAVVCTDCVYDDCGNVLGYYYYDPQANNSGDTSSNSGYVSVNDVAFIYEVSGCLN
jgi:hypothetical protein